MLTDRQFIALTFLANTINNEADLVFLVRGSGKIFDFVLKAADMFLEKTKSSSSSSENPTHLIEQLEGNNNRLEKIIAELDVQYLESTSGD
ncbi:hypothetical protein [Planktothrix serta]|uniref:hypothetical protein n=1 Tax=Planktothrix serta TaxID=1678310 RepID=UPI0009FB3BE9|nr:hypothetical protein [Planktothrix serta]